MFKKTVLSTFAIALIVALLGVLASYESGGMSSGRVADRIGHGASSVLLPREALAQAGGNASIADIAEKSIDSVVNIASTRVVQNAAGNSNSPFYNDPFFRRFFGPDAEREVPQERREQSLGSGVIVSDDGIILTNNHVVEDTEDLKVTLHDKREYEAEVVGTDPATDVAVIRLKGNDINGLKPMTFGDSDKLRLGDTVLAIGNPFGLSHTVTMGIVSAKGRSFNGAQRITDYENFIQTDAAINPGNSGGALVNMNGELIGINTAIVSRSGGYQGIGFAIPSNMANMIMEGLVTDGKIVRGWLGVQIQDVTPDIAAAMDLKTNDGAVVSDVIEDSPAEKGGLKSGDVIVGIEGKKIDSANDLRNRIAMLGADSKIDVTVVRKGKEKKLRVTLAERTDEVVLASSGGGGGAGGGERDVDGLKIAPLNDVTREKYNIPDTIKSGIVVVSVDQSRLDSRGLREGDVILEVGQEPVSSVEAFKEKYDHEEEKLLVYVYRNGSRFFTVLEKN